jgi:hypothetical protein
VDRRFEPLIFSVQEPHRANHFRWCTGHIEAITFSVYQPYRATHFLWCTGTSRQSMSLVHSVRYGPRANQFRPTEGRGAIRWLIGRALSGPARGPLVPAQAGRKSQKLGPAKHGKTLAGASWCDALGQRGGSPFRAVLWKPSDVRIFSSAGWACVGGTFPVQARYFVAARGTNSPIIGRKRQDKPDPPML